MKSWKTITLVAVTIIAFCVYEYFNHKKHEHCYEYCEESEALGTDEDKQECFCFCMYDEPCGVETDRYR